jgi:amino acid adenylation domain-containing protein/thioester reductase-like protein
MPNEPIEGFRLSPQQKHLWQLHQLEQHVPYRVQAAVLLAGELNIEAIKLALQNVVDRHEILRTTFHHLPGMTIPLQVIANTFTIPIGESNLNHLSWHQQETAIETLFHHLKQTSFKLEQCPPVFVHLIALSPKEHIFLISLSSLIADGFTLNYLIKIILNEYSGILKGKNLPEDDPMQYADIAEWKNELLESDKASIGQAYWREHLHEYLHEKNIEAIADLTFWFEQRSTLSSEFQPEYITLTIPNKWVKSLESLAQNYDVELAEFLLACWYVLLCKIAGQTSIVIGFCSHGRNYAELQSAPGLLATYLPLHCQLDANSLWADVLTQIKALVNQAREWQDYFTWDDIIQEKQNQTYSSFYAACFEFEDWLEPYQTSGISGSIYKRYACLERFKLKLSCLRQPDAIVTEFHYDAARYYPDAIHNLSNQFQTLLENVVNSSNSTVGQLEILSDRDRQQILVEFNNTTIKSTSAKLIHQRIEAQANRTPNDRAVVFEDQSLTYTQLNARANQLAHHLKRRGVGPEELVVLYVDRSLDLIIGMLGILKAGGAYVPLDPALPRTGLSIRLQETQATMLLTQASLIETLPEHNAQMICLDKDWDMIAAESQENPASIVRPENLAYVLFTSGSTGKPKGVAVEHRQLLNYVNAIVETLDLAVCNDFAIVSTFAADLGNTTVFPSLCQGGCLHIVSSERASDPDALADYFHRHPVDCLKIVPSHLAALLTSSHPEWILPRQRLILGGEACHWTLIQQIQTYAPTCQIFNHYGPTETTVGALTYAITPQQIDGDAGIVPIGRPIANVSVYLLDSHQHPVPIGVPGELYIGGAGVARGYLKQPDLTAAAFVPHPFVEMDAIASEQRLYKTGDLARYQPDGTLEFLGRVDHQVKIRGFRIELGEIEAALVQHPAVRSAIALVHGDQPTHQHLVVYIVRHTKFATKTSELRHFLREKLPDYAIPSMFVWLKALPLTPNGKVDRRALPVPNLTRAGLDDACTEPRTPIETQLAEIWTTILRLDRVGIDDNFFDLGGHSLLLTQLLMQVRDVFQVDLPLLTLLESPTIADLAPRIAAIQQRVSTDVGRETSVDLASEVVLDPSIRPNIVSGSIPTSGNAIFLTGATGFLGAFLLYELLQKTPAEVYCLVRSPDVESGKKKLQRVLESYLLWDESFQSRIIPVLGDLSQPRLALSEAEFQTMARQIDVIYHNGAQVHHTSPYSVLKPANVKGTEEILRLASQTRIKPVHFISTINVFSHGFSSLDRSGIQMIQEQDSIDRPPVASNGYVQSKWVAERLVTIARDRGLPVYIYRPGRISGHSQTGVFNPNDFLYRLIIGCIQLGSVPSDDIYFNIAPVDYVSQAIIHLSHVDLSHATQQQKSIEPVFHLVNPHSFSISKLIDAIRALGFLIQPIPYHQWQAGLLNAARQSPESPLYSLVPFFSATATQETSSDADKLVFDCRNTCIGLAGTAIACPPVDDQLLHTYLSYLNHNGFLTALK